jgi:hypothetical protein
VTELSPYEGVAGQPANLSYEATTATVEERVEARLHVPHSLGGGACARRALTRVRVQLACEGRLNRLFESRILSVVSSCVSASVALFNKGC